MREGSAGIRQPTGLLVRRSQRRLVLSLVVSIGLTLVAILFLIQAGNWLERIFATSLGLFAGLASFFFGWSLFDRSAIVEITPEGFVDRGSPVRAGLLRWDEIRRFEPVQLGRQTALAVHVYRPQRYAASLHGEQRRVAETMIQQYGTPIVIPWVGLDRRLEFVIEVAEEWGRQVGE